MYPFLLFIVNKKFQVYLDLFIGQKAVEEKGSCGAGQRVTNLPRARAQGVNLNK